MWSSALCCVAIFYLHKGRGDDAARAERFWHSCRRKPPVVGDAVIALLKDQPAG